MLAIKRDYAVAEKTDLELKLTPGTIFMRSNRARKCRGNA